MDGLVPIFEAMKTGEKHRDFCIDDAMTLSLTVSGKYKAHFASAMVALQRIVGSTSLRAARLFGVT